MRTFTSIMLLAFCLNTYSVQMTESLKVKEYKLKNGLTIWLNEDHSQPKIFGAVIVKAGAKDCPDTGIAHYFEHMMFKGTDKIGTTDYTSEKKVLDKIAAKYDELAVSKEDSIRKRIQKEINELSIVAAQYAIPNEFNRLISKYGGSQLNAGTSYDFTTYFNTFSPQYISQWAEINSERLLHPVFRLFQSELETVYEEKNMYSDFMGALAMEKLTEKYFYPHPYAYPIIGSTANLKNPRLSQMQQFFEDYYVGSNIGLILSGDFSSEEVFPILETAFSRIRAGEVPKIEPVVLPPFKGKEKIKVKVPVPFVKMMALGFRGVPANHKDQVALNIAVGILNNANGTGYLDQLSVDRKIMAAMSLNQSLNEAGILGILIIPKLIFQSYGSAEKLVWKEIERVKNGDFTDEIFSSLKLEQKRNYESSLEDISTRSNVMMTLFSQGKTWNDYLKEIEHINSLTKEDVAAIAQKYFNKNYLYATKKTGNYPKDNLPKPDFAPIVPKNADAVSDYAKELEKLPVKNIAPRFVDFEKDVKMKSLTSLVTLYSTPNPVNDIFTFTLSYGIGTTELPMLSQLKSYLPFLGTDSMPFKEFREKLQVLGSTLEFETDEKKFMLKVSGFETNFAATLDLVGKFMKFVKADEKQLKQVVDEEKVASKAFVKSSDNMASALLEFIKYGDKSSYLTKLSLSEVKKLKGKDLLEAFSRVKKVECSMHYCGTSPLEQIAEQVNKYVDLKEVTVPATSSYREVRSYDKPLVYFIHDPKVSQSIVHTYTCGEAISDGRMRSASKLFTGYFGGDMSSLMFQEIREFRSLAYRTRATFNLPARNYPDRPGYFVTMLSTQSDKTLDALEVLVSLINEMPAKADRVNDVRQTIFNEVNNNYPSFRSISQKIAFWKEDGFVVDPNKQLIADIEAMDMEQLVDFYKSQIQGRPLVYMIIGNEKKIDMDKLSTYGEIVNVKKSMIYK